jgi:hypothetical protein
VGAGVERSEQDAENDRRTLGPLATGENEDTKGSTEKDQRREARRSENPARRPGVKTRRAKLVDLDAAQTAEQFGGEEDWRRAKLNIICRETRTSEVARPIIGRDYLSFHGRRQMGARLGDVFRTAPSLRLASLRLATLSDEKPQPVPCGVGRNWLLVGAREADETISPSRRYLL